MTYQTNLPKTTIEIDKNKNETVSFSALIASIAIFLRRSESSLVNPTHNFKRYAPKQLEVMCGIKFGRPVPDR